MSRYRIKTLNKISPYGLDYFDTGKYKYGNEMENPDAIMVRSAAMHDMEMNDKLLAIARAGAGVNNIPVDSCGEKGIVVFNTPGANANAVKELVIAGMLISSRKVISGIEWAKTLKGQGDEVGKLVEKGKSAFTGPEISGKKLGVIGLGAIGILVANTAKSLGMEVYGYDPYVSVESAWKLSRAIKRSANLRELYAECDYISLHLPLTSETRHMINAESISSMKDGARILNFARGDLAHDEDIIAALSSGKISAYITDFPSDALIGVDGVIAIPHLGASTPESEDNCAQMAAIQLIDYLENGNITNSVNFPNVNLPRNEMVRICIIHRNIPHMLTKISGKVAEEGVNIENMVNHSKGDFAYTIFDTAGRVPDKVVDNISSVEGVIRVRIIYH